MSVDHGTTAWSDAATTSRRLYVGGATACVIDAVAAEPAQGWAFAVHTADGKLVCMGANMTLGEPGRELARAMCDAALGHVPLNGYRVSRRKGEWTHTVVLARNGIDAKRRARQPGDMQRAMRRDYREEKLRPRELRAYYQGRFTPPSGEQS